MVGFPPANQYIGIGVFSHAIKLSHRMSAPKILNEPRLLGHNVEVNIQKTVVSQYVLILF
jgi:hypothetical protein